MSKLSIFLVAFITLSISFSCRYESEKVTKMNPTTGEILVDAAAEVDEFSRESPIPKGVRIVKNMRDKYSDERIEAMNREAIAVIEYRKKEKPQNHWEELTQVYWEYQFIFAGSNKSKPGELDGRWVKYDPDFTYTYGYFENTQGAGRYHYNPQDQVLLMVDDNTKVKPTEYKLIMATNIMIMQGTSIYEDNNFQCKMKGMAEMPQNP